MKKEEKAIVALWKQNLGMNPQWAIRGLMRIYREQTENEKAIDRTEENNGVGFTGTDAEILSSFAKQVEKDTGKYPLALSPKQMAILFKRMPKYAGQLYRLTH